MFNNLNYSFDAETGDLVVNQQPLKNVITTKQKKGRKRGENP